MFGHPLKEYQVNLIRRSPLQAWLFVLFLYAGSACANEPIKSFAQIWRINGVVTAASGQPTQVRGLKSGDTVYVGEQLHAAANGEAVLRMEDGGYLAMRPGAQFLVEDFSAAKSDSDHVSLKLVQGGLRLITGWIGKLNPKGYRVQTPSASIGVRGTDHEAYFLTPQMAAAWSQKVGTYDKVISGQTYLQTADGTIDIAPGQVGFARAAHATKTRALITLLLPVILEKVPEFFVPGQFDAELDQLSPATVFEETRPGATPLPEARPLRGVDASATARPQILARLPDGSCNALVVAQAWLAQLDEGLARKDAPGVLALFAADVTIRATVVDASGVSKVINLGKDEFASGAMAAVKALSDYSQRRLSVSGDPVNANTCDAVSVKSVVLEQGKQNGKPYRFETIEEYQLLQVKGQWLAISASSRQQ